MSEAPALEVDTVFADRYRLLRQLGKDGYGRVFLGITVGPTSLAKLVVLKIQSFTEEEGEDRAAFLKEARLSALQNHRNIVSTLEVVEDQGRAAIVMEYLEGQSLPEVLTALGDAREAGTLTHLQVVSVYLYVIAGALAALHHAHEDAVPAGRAPRVST